MLRTALRRLAVMTRGAVDLASIMVGVLVIGLIAGVISATVFAVIPWAQDRTAAGNLDAVATAESVAKAKDSKYFDGAALKSAGYLPETGLNIRTDTAGSCYAVFIKSGSGNYFYRTSAGSDVKQVSGAWPSTGPAGFPAACDWPVTSAVAVGREATNLVKNPSFEMASTATVEVRRNLAVAPRGTVALKNYGTGSTTVTPVAVTGGPASLNTALRVSYIANADYPGVIIQSDLTPARYTVSAWVFHETVSPSAIAHFAIHQVRGQPGAPKPAAGVWERLSWSTDIGANQSIGFRLDDVATPGSYLITGMMVEQAPTLGTYFDGSTPSTDTLSNAWAGGFDNSASVQRQKLADVTSIHAVNLQDETWSASGTKSLLQRGNTAANTDSYTNPISDVEMNSLLKPSTTYTFMATVRIDKPVLQTNPVNGSRALFLHLNGNHVPLAGVTSATNTTGVHELRATFTTPSSFTGYNTIRLYSGMVTGSGELWWDNVAVIEGVHTAPYFDGDSPGARWIGTPHASASVSYVE